jgi:short subunit dehydrogenase-like uncharacterized protein
MTNAANTATAREFDVVLFGATGFTGQLVAEYLRDQGPDGLRWAVAGRDRAKLQAVVERLALGVEVIVANASDAAALSALAARTRVVCTTVGPYAKYGLPLVTACAANGTHYADITGEVQFVRASIDACHDAAKASGARIVHSCGFDSIPSDLGVLLLAHTAANLPANTGSEPLRLGEVKYISMAAKGGFSGGTVASLLNLMEEAGKDPALRKLLADPYSLSPDRGADLTIDGRDPTRAHFDTEEQLWLAPFIMGPANTRIVRRSNALLGHGFGRRFGYTESMKIGRGFRGELAARAVAAGMLGFLGAAAIPQLRPALRRLLPKPGEGPAKALRDAGFFHTRLLGKTQEVQARSIEVNIHGIGDPGYNETAKMLGESTLALALDPAPNLLTGVLTPATALGLPLVDRLRNAGMRWEVQVRPR